MHDAQRQYIAIDLKSFFASVECVERGLNPLTTNLVVADTSRTDKTICLAVTPSLKAYGIGGRARLFEVNQRLREVNGVRRMKLASRRFAGKSADDTLLKKHPDWEIDYIAAVPRMAYYIKYSTRIYDVYLKYVAPEDIFAYSIDEVFIDITNYLNTYRKNAREMASIMVDDVFRTTGITATAGIGSNMYLCKVAMDIMAKHAQPDENGVRIAELNEKTYREQLWDYRPLSKFWRIGHATASKLESLGIYTMGQLSRYSIKHEEVLYKLFGVNAELIIDHAWGWEPCTMEYVKAYKPEINSFSNGQVLQSPYNYDMARIVVKEMADNMALKLVEHQMVASQIGVSIGYDKNCLSNNTDYDGPIVRDHYGRKTPKPAHGTVTLSEPTSSSSIIIDAAMAIYDKLVDRSLMIRRMYVVANNVTLAHEGFGQQTGRQLDLFSNYEEFLEQKAKRKEEMAKEHKVQETLVSIKKKYGKNSILKGMNLQKGATAKERNRQIGGHKA